MKIEWKSTTLTGLTNQYKDYCNESYELRRNGVIDGDEYRELLTYINQSLNKHLLQQIREEEQ